MPAPLWDSIELTTKVPCSCKAAEPEATPARDDLEISRDPMSGLRLVRRREAHVSAVLTSSISPRSLYIAPSGPRLS